MRRKHLGKGIRMRNLMGLLVIAAVAVVAFVPGVWESLWGAVTTGVRPFAERMAEGAFGS